MIKRLAVVMLLLALGAAWYAALPPRVRTLPSTGTPLADPVRGAFHVHTNRSDGTGSVDDVAAGAARAGLTFVVFTEHGDATRAPDPPQYRSNVLCIDAVEISTEGGHVVALGLPAAPYPLGGEPRDVIEDIHRLGGFSIAAHAGSARPELRWTDWTPPIDGLEWLNADSEWRDEPVWSLWRALITYPFRRTETLAALLDRPTPLLQQWDGLTQHRRVVAIAGADAHARLGLRSLGEPYDNTVALHLPSYEQMFRLFSNSLEGVRLTGDAPKDAESVLAAIRAGRVYSTIEGVGGPGTLTFTATSGDAQASIGGMLNTSGATTLRVQVDPPTDAHIDLFRNGVIEASATGTTLEHVVDAGSGPAVYRTEVSLPGAPGQPPVPWLVSNPIYLGRIADEPPAPRPAPSTVAIQYGDGPAPAWRVETSPASLGALDVVPSVRGTQLALRYALGGTASSSPYVSFVMPAGAALAQYDRLMFTARADHPARISVQLRQPGGEEGQRWHRSVYVDSEPREITVFFDDLTPRGTPPGSKLTLENVRSVSFVLDTVNTPLGGRGQLWIDDVRYGR
jgi:hypothetical protein